MGPFSEVGGTPTLRFSEIGIFNLPELFFWGKMGQTLTYNGPDPLYMDMDILITQVVQI